MKMDQNNNGAVIKQIAKKSLAGSRTRNIFTCLTIAMGVALVLTFVLYLFGNSKQQLRTQEDTPQVSYLDITPEQAEQLKGFSEIKWLGLSKSVGSSKVGSNRLGVIYQDEIMMEKNEISYTGELPQKDGEIMVPRDYLKQLGLKIQPGDTVSLDLGDKTVREYKVTGIVDTPSKTSNNHRIYVSLPCALALTGDEECLLDATVNLNHAVNMTFPQAEETAAALGEKIGLTQEQSKVSEAFFNQASISRLTATSVAALALVAILILAAAGLVIHNIFYIAVAGKVREYGQMRTLGMTRKQVRSLVSREGTSLAAKGIPLGLVIGALMGYLLIPGGWDWKTTLGGMAVCAVLGFAAVRISVSKPGKIAAKTAPVEAISYTGYSQKQGVSKKRYSYLTPGNLAVLNLKRSKKKSFLTMCSLVLAGVLLGAISSFVISYNPGASVESSFPNGDYQLQLSAESGFGSQDLSEEGRMKQYAALQSSGIIGNETRKEVEGIDGVTATRPWRYLNVSTDLFQKETNLGINGFSKDEFEWVKQMGYDGPQTYEELISQPGLIVETESNSNFKEFPVKRGDVIHVATYNGRGERIEKDFPVVGTFHYISWMMDHRKENKKLPITIMGSTLLMPSETLDDWAGMDTTYGFEIETDQKKSGEVGETLEKLYGSEENLFLNSKTENMAYLDQMFLPAKIILFVLAGFLVVFGVINLMNTILTNLFTRKRELGILQAVGMTREQMKKMLGRESLIYVAVTIVCTLTFGGLLGYGLVDALDQMGMSVKYQYPWIPVLLFVAVLGAMQTGMTRYGVQLLQKQTLSERMRKAD